MHRAKPTAIALKPDTDLQALLSQPAAVVAKRLLGCHIIRELNGQTCRVKIVETEAYDQSDAASHSHWGITPRTKVMFGPAGYTYVYFTYGMHYCFNIVTGLPGEGSAVLIRAVEPITGLEVLHNNRLGHTGITLTNGPAKLCQALKIDKSLYGHNLSTAPLQLVVEPPILETVTTTTRIGISQAQSTLWRFYITGNPYVSKM